MPNKQTKLHILQCIKDKSNSPQMFVRVFFFFFNKETHHGPQFLCTISYNYFVLLCTKNDLYIVKIAFWYLQEKNNKIARFHPLTSQALYGVVKALLLDAISFRNFNFYSGRWLLVAVIGCGSRVKEHLIPLRTTTKKIQKVSGKSKQ